MKVNTLFGVFFIVMGCGESPDSFSMRSTDEDTNKETENSSDSESESDEIFGRDTLHGSDTDHGKETDVDTDSDTDMETDTGMVTESDTDIGTDTAMDMETDTIMEGGTDTDTDMDTEMDADTDEDTDTDIFFDTDTDTESSHDAFVCQQDNVDTTIANGCPFDLHDQMYDHCVTETIWICPLTDSVEYFGYNNYQSEWAICDDQSGSPVCPEFYVCVQVDGFGRQCV
jgi:hypothetical protein